MERIASGIWFMKSLIGGWSLMLGQNEPYSITSAPRLIAHASRLRPPRVGDLNAFWPGLFRCDMAS